MENILYTISDATAEITLNRPLKRNALDGGMIRDLTAAFTDADMRTDVRAVMLRANGTAFCAGADLAYLKEIAQNDIAANRTDSRHLMELFRAVYFSAKPSVAVVNGPALAGGCGLATVCDITIASSEAVFGYTEVRIGFIPAVVMVFLRQKIGDAAARDLVMRGNTMSAEEARRIGLIAHVAPPDRLEESAHAIIAELLRGSASAQHFAKKMFATLPGMTLESGLDYAATMNAFARQTGDCKRGLELFLSRSAQ